MMSSEGHIRVPGLLWVTVPAFTSRTLGNPQRNLSQDNLLVSWLGFELCTSQVEDRSVTA
jgi:hypothetical protein